MVYNRDTDAVGLDEAGANVGAELGAVVAADGAIVDAVGEAVDAVGAPVGGAEGDAVDAVGASEGARVVVTSSTGSAVELDVLCPP